MTKIEEINALEILDSRGNPTLQVFIKTSKGLISSASVPSGASTGFNEALELRDNDKDRYLGKGVLKAINSVLGPLKDLLIGKSVFDQKQIDLQMIQLDGSDNKSKFGANSILGISLAIAKAGALASNLELFQYLGKLYGNNNPCLLPLPMMNVINGGAHADNTIEFQEFMIQPVGAPNFAEGIRWSAEVFHHLKKLLQKMKLSTSVGDEGGFAPNLKSNQEACEFILTAISNAGYEPIKDFALTLDCAATEFYNSNTNRYFEKKNPSSEVALTYKEQVAILKNLTLKFPIISIEDGLAENNWEGWEYLTQTLSGIQIVGDDIFVTNPKFLKQGIDKNIANAILIKLNQIGTLTETFETIRFAQLNNYKTIISHRSGETEDTFIADLAVATSSGQIKTGSLSRSDRVSKYNRLLRIEQLLNSDAKYFRIS
ncbi:MAG: Enolase [Chlamydiae bacterium]|nr:Enolase [Chlamydiota bacterium]